MNSDDFVISYINKLFNKKIFSNYKKLKEVVEINSRNQCDDELEISFIPMASIQEGVKSNNFTSESRKWKEIKNGYTHVRNGDIVLAKISPSFENRKSSILRNLKNGYGSATTEIFALTPKKDILTDYLFWFLKNETFIRAGSKGFKGSVGQQRIKRDFLENYEIPLPDKDIQKKIVKDIEKIIYFSTLLEKKEILDKNFEEQIKAIILEITLQGKLLKKDEYVVEKKLEEKIRNKKLALLQKDNLKYKEYIFDENYKKYPEHWVVTALGNVSILKNGRTPKSNDIYKEGEVPFFKVAQMNGPNNQVYLIDTPYYLNSYNKFALPKGTVVFPKNGGAIKTNKKRILNQDALIDLNTCGLIPVNILPEYLLLIMKEIDLGKIEKGTSTPTLNTDLLLSVKVGIPPLQEQRLILDKYQKLTNLYNI